MISWAKAIDILPAELAKATISPSFTNLETASSMGSNLVLMVSILWKEPPLSWGISI